MRCVSEGEIINAGEAPKLRKAAITTQIFREMCHVAFQAMKYKQLLEAQYASVWTSVPAADRWFRRLLIGGEPALREMFSRALTLAGAVETMNVLDSDPASDLAGVLGKLGAAVDALKQTRTSGPESSHQEESKESAAEAKPSTAESTAPDVEQKSEKPKAIRASLQAPAPPMEGKGCQPRAPPEDPLLGSLAKARMSLDDAMVMYDRCWKTGDAVPPAMQSRGCGARFVSPSPPTSRGLPHRAVSVLRGAGVGALVLCLGLGVELARLVKGLVTEGWVVVAVGGCGMGCFRHRTCVARFIGRSTRSALAARVSDTLEQQRCGVAWVGDRLDDGKSGGGSGEGVGMGGFRRRGCGAIHRPIHPLHACDQIDVSDTLEQQRCGSRGGRVGGRGVESQAWLSSTWGACVGEPPLRGRPYCSGVLELFDEGSVVVLGLGHECEQRASAQARLKAMTPALEKPLSGC